MKPTYLYGCSDDLIEIDGGISEEYNRTSAKIAFSDGTVAEIKYGKVGLWRISVLAKGTLFDRLEPWVAEDGRREDGDLAGMSAYSDVLVLNDKPQWAARVSQITNA